MLEWAEMRVFRGSRPPKHRVVPRIAHAFAESEADLGKELGHSGTTAKSRSGVTKPLLSLRSAGRQATNADSLGDTRSPKYSPKAPDVSISYSGWPEQGASNWAPHSGNWDLVGKNKIGLCLLLTTSNSMTGARQSFIPRKAKQGHPTIRKNLLSVFPRRIS
jgi:hypothetical protein